MNLPQVVINALRSNEYTQRDGYSATTLIRPPQMVVLEKRYGQDKTDDMDRLWSVFGTAVHNVFEKYKEEDALSEAHFSLDMLDTTVHGTIDHYRDSIISDFKVTSAWKYVKGDFSDWETQLNTYAYLMRDRYTVKKLQIIAVFRDWSEMQSMRGGDYPDSPIKVISIPLWTSDQQYEYIQTRVIQHLHADTLPDNKLPLCTDEERWATPDKWALTKRGNKRATKLYDTEEEARKAQRASVGRFDVDLRQGESKRCLKYCPVASKCHQFKRMCGGKV